MPQTFAASPDLLLVNGVVHTMDEDRTVTQAVAIEDGQISAVGTDKAVLSLKSESTEVINLGGSALFPGFTDAHVHLLSGGATLLDLSFTDQDNAQSIQSKLQQYALENPDLAVITGRGWSLTQFANGNPHKRLLDEVVPNRPVVLIDSNYHSAWANSRALDMAGISASTPDPLNGKIERDHTGVPTGTLRETATYLVNQLIPAPSLTQKRTRIRKAIRHLHAHGVTAFLAAAVNQVDDDAWSDLAPSAHAHLALLPATLPLHADKQASRISSVINELTQRRQHLKNAGIKASHVKVFLDGGLESCTAAFVSHYADAGCGPQHRTQVNFPEAFLTEYFQQLQANGFSLHIHSIGDLTTRVALDAMPHGSKLRHGIAHLQFVHPDDQPRFKAAGVSAVIQSLWAYPYDDSMLPFENTAIGPWRYPFGSLAEAGADLVAGSDWPVSTANPFHALEVAVLRRDPEADSGTTWLSDQTITVDQYMEALTINGARYLGEDAVRGSIEVGKQADLVVLTQDPYQVGAEHLSDIAIKATIFSGEFVYER